MVTRNRKMYNSLKDAGFTDKDIENFSTSYLELLAEALMDGIVASSSGIKETKLANKMYEDKLVYKRNGKLYIEE